LQRSQLLDHLLKLADKTLTIERILEKVPATLRENIERLSVEEAKRLKLSVSKAVVAYHLKRGWHDYDEAIPLSIDDFFTALEVMEEERVAASQNDPNTKHALWDILVSGNNPEDLGDKLYENLESIAMQKLIDGDPTLHFTEDIGVLKEFYRTTQTLEGLLYVIGQPTKTLVNIDYLASKRQLGVSVPAVAAVLVLLGEELNLFDRSPEFESVFKRLSETKSNKIAHALKRIDGSLRAAIETLRNTSTMEITARYVKNPVLLAKLQVILLVVGVFYTIRNSKRQRHRDIVN
ncbi:MAG: hypothetical protein NZM26_05525, partial [Patescibacteria group bacterium]|nr:hypothetical protein [Patescibacteria group bacterium]